LRVHRVAVLERAVLDDAPPLRDLALDLLAPPTVLLAFELRQQRAQRLPRVADERDVDRVADPDPARLQLDLDTSSLPLLGQKFRVWEARADHQQRVAAADQLVARGRSEQADRAGDER